MSLPKARYRAAHVAPGGDTVQGWSPTASPFVRSSRSTLRRAEATLLTVPSRRLETPLPLPPRLYGKVSADGTHSPTAETSWRRSAELSGRAEPPIWIVDLKPLFWFAAVYDSKDNDPVGSR